MKFETNIEQFAGAVGVATRFSEKRPNLPVLASILIVAQSGQLTLRSTNLECGVEITIPAKVSEGGTVAIPSTVLAGFVHNVKGKSLNCTLVGEVCKLETERASASIKTIPHDDFPILPRVSAEHSFTQKANELARALRSVVFCASTSTVKPELQSVLLYAEGGKLTTVATDSFRLAEKTVPLRAGGSVPQLLIPARNAAELMRILETAGSSEVEMYYNDNQLSTQIENTYYTSRLIDGSFPNYQQILPKSFSTEVVVLREDFSTALKSLAIFSDKFSQIILTIDPEQKAVLLTSRNPDVGEQTSTIRATIAGDALTMSFNSRYLADSVQAITGESVRIHANGAGKAILIKDATDQSFLYLAMPMNR
jgi:DNA polymerase-3 subunit beta